MPRTVVLGKQTFDEVSDPFGVYLQYSVEDLERCGLPPETLQVLQDCIQNKKPLQVLGLREEPRAHTLEIRYCLGMEGRPLTMAWAAVCQPVQL